MLLALGLLSFLGHTSPVLRDSIDILSPRQFIEDSNALENAQVYGLKVREPQPTGATGGLEPTGATLKAREPQPTGATDGPEPTGATLKARQPPPTHPIHPPGYDEGSLNEPYNVFETPRIWTSLSVTGAKLKAREPQETGPAQPPPTGPAGPQSTG